ncbi:MAG: DUF371 domain-containing protein [Candidatus Woesearchaeota archaeon]
MEYSFSAKGHPNILSTQKNTIEITKDKELTLDGDCIVAVEADFSLAELKKFLAADRIKLKIEAAGLEDEITAIPNPSFNSSNEIVLRKGEYASERTFGIRADKSAKDLDRRLVEELRKGADVKLKFTTY